MLYHQHHHGDHAGHPHRRQLRGEGRAGPRHGGVASGIQERGARMLKDASRLAQVIDHTLVRPDATQDDLAAACADAKRYGFACVVVNSSCVAYARELLSGTLVKVCSVVGFPHGAHTTTVKIVEAMEAMKNGASELDIVVNIGMVKSDRPDVVEIDLK